MNLKRIANPVPAMEPLLHIADSKLWLNAYAASLLHLDDNSRVDFLYDQDHAFGDHKRIYIGTVQDGGFHLRRRMKTFYIYSTDLARALAKGLQGTGTYRIEANDYERDFRGNKFYSIFFVKYDK